ncbi:uncharacterized protein LOC110924493 [Helianthus annuus]|uniref:uncharacterized protein LOC110924493 n=1 Tax=Helianthus annuus TaxID=4232 RepID=UPI000B8EEFE9|nr:uncharacterized protein LOC110924493 [Helianthus annuus]
MTWGWRKLLSIRSLVRPFIWKKIRSGAQTNAWSDNWCQFSLLNSFISPRVIANAGFNLQSSVNSLVDDHGHWRWPQAWLDLFPVLINIETPALTHQIEDNLIWKDLEGNQQQFSLKEVWNNIRNSNAIVNWANLIWFAQCIPRHSFHMWLVIMNKLSTQDRLRAWEVGSETNRRLMCYPLCKHDRDSRDHLFFQCSFAAQVWNNVKVMVDLSSVNDSWDPVMDWMIQHANTKKIEHIICKLVIAASTYFIWQERNARLFTPNQNSVSGITEKIMNIVRLRVMGFKATKDANFTKLMRKWKIPILENNNGMG